MSLLPDAIELTKAIKRAAIDAVNAEKPVEICFGKVKGTSPLKILVEQKMMLGSAQLILSHHLTDYKIQMTVDHYTEGADDDRQDANADADLSALIPHCHAYRGKKEFTIHNGLGVGDEVILIRQQGGQKYIVLDKIG